MPEAPGFHDEVTRSLVREGYDQIAVRYSQLAADVQASHPRRERTSTLLARLPAQSAILEAGCGGGLPVAAEILQRGHAYVGVDVSRRQIELARQQVPGGDFRCGDVLEQSFEDDAFDAVMALYAITHVPRDRWSELITDFHRWLRPGGILLVSVPHGDSPGWLEEDFLGLGSTNWTNGYGIEATLEMLATAGFDVLEALPLVDDDSGAERWVWVTATKARAEERPPPAH